MGTNSQEYSRKYYKEHRDKMLENAKQKIKCEVCGSIVPKGHIKRHKRGYLCNKNETGLKP